MQFLNCSRADSLTAGQPGVLCSDRIFLLRRLLGAEKLPVFGWSPERANLHVKQFERDLAGIEWPADPGLELHQVIWLPPVSPPASFRDFYAFEEHVRTARRNRGLEMIPEWYDQPVFYFSNPHCFVGHDADVAVPPDGDQLDFELEIACVIDRSGRDIPVHQAEEHIAGYSVLNDWSARDVQRREMKIGLGPAKGKDFATSMGPCLVTPGELADRRSGKGYDLKMTARRNGVTISEGNWSSIYFSFAEMIAWASRGVTLQAGDVLGSGTVGTGCILERGPENVGGWLQPGDVVELEVERLGVLRNRVVSTSGS